MLRTFNEIEEITAGLLRSAARVAHLTLGSRLRLGLLPNVMCESYTRTREFLVFLLVLTFARNQAEPGRKC